MLLSKRTKLIFEIIITICVCISVTVGGVFLYLTFTSTDSNYFFEHFGLAVALFSIGIVALLLPVVTNSRYQGNGKDSIMILVGFALIICALVAIIYSYMISY